MPRLAGRSISVALLAALLACIPLSVANALLYGNAWWEVAIAGLGAAALLIACNELLPTLYRDIDSTGAPSRSATSRDIAVFAGGQVAGLALAVPFALVISPLVLAVMAGFVAYRALLAFWISRQARNRQETDEEIRKRRTEALDGARGTATFTAVLIWAVAILAVVLVMVSPSPIIMMLFVWSWTLILASYSYLVRLF